MASSAARPSATGSTRQFVRRSGPRTRACPRCRRPERCAWRGTRAEGRAAALLDDGDRIARRRQPAQSFLDVSRRCQGAPRKRALGDDAVLRQVRLAGGDPDLEDRASAFAALDTNVAAMELHELVDEREADAAALVGARPGALDAVEALEEAWQLGRRDADAGVPHRRARSASPSARSEHPDLPFERELERVREQVEDDLLPHVAVDVDRLRRAAGSRPRSGARRARSPSGRRSRARA